MKLEEANIEFSLKWFSCFFKYLMESFLDIVQFYVIYTLQTSLYSHALGLALDETLCPGANPDD